MYLTLLTLKLKKLNKLHQRKHIKIFVTSSLTAKSYKLFDFHKSLIILTYIKILPYNLQNKESIPTVTYKSGNTIRNNILNYKDEAISIYIIEEVSFSLNTDLCECERSTYCKPPCKHILIGDNTYNFEKICFKGKNKKFKQKIQP